MGEPTAVQSPPVSVVILSHNRRQAVGVVLDQLRELPVDEVIVVDSASIDGTAQMLLARGDVRIIALRNNVAVAGRNVGARAARNEFVLMLDDDAYPLPGAIEALLAAFAHDDRLAVAGGLVRDIDPKGRIVQAHGPGTFDWWFRTGQKHPRPPAGWPTFFFPEGACMVRRSIFLDVGGFFEPYWLGTSEVDVTTRLVAAHYEVRYVPEATFDHMKVQAGRLSGALARQYRVRNQLWYFWLRFPLSLAARRIPAYLLFDLIELTWHGQTKQWAIGIGQAWRQRDVVRHYRAPLGRDALRRAELNRGRLHLRLLWEQAWLNMGRWVARRAVATPPAAPRPRFRCRTARSSRLRWLATLGR
jgi:GT2 family glycosyltransferase